MERQECHKPHCSKQPTETYRGENGNTLKLCSTHYYKLVSRGLTYNIDTNGTDLPFWDSGIRCDTTTDDSVTLPDMEDPTGLKLE